MTQNKWFSVREEEDRHFDTTVPLQLQQDFEKAVEAALVGEMTGGQFRQLIESRHFGASFAMRNIYCRRVGWSVMTKEWIQDVATMLRGKRVLEVGAGRGILGTIMPLLTGADWTCTDGNPPEGADHVIRMEAMRAVETFKPDVVFASWIPYGSHLDIELARAVPCVFVGEVSGCTGSYDFWEDDDASFRVEYPEIQDVPQWPGIHDITFRTFPTPQ